MRTCCYCKTDFTDNQDCRPYGPGGAMTCFPCGMKPENIAATQTECGRVIDAAIDQGTGAIYIGGEDGPAALPPIGSDPN